MAKRFAEAGVSFLFVYTREAHPAEHLRHHLSFAQKLDAARAMVERWSIERQMLVDDLEGTVHRAYGMLPNMSFIINRAGTVLYKASWTDPKTIEVALEHLGHERELRRARHRLSPYTVEWMPQRINDREPFCRGLLEAGPQALDEFISAIETTHGEPAARGMKQWRADHQEEDDP